MNLVFLVADFPLQAVLRLPTASPELPGLESASGPAPAALFSHRSRRSVVLVANAAARAAGVEPGLRSGQALAHCPDLRILTARAEAEAEAQAALLAAALRVAPHVELTAPGIATLDVHGLAAGIPEQSAATALARLAALGLDTRAGLARTPGLALLAAQAAGPGRLRSVRPEEEQAFLDPQPLEALAPDPALAAVLQDWGLETCGRLTAIPRDELGRRLGAAGVALWDQARGGQPRPLRRDALPLEFFARLELEHEVETLEPLLFLLRRLLDRLALELEAATLAASAMWLELSLADATVSKRDFRLPEPTREAAALLRVLHTHLETVRAPAPVVALALRLEPTRPAGRQADLFETGLRDPHGFADTLARVGAIVGLDRVGTPQLEDTHRPDAVRLIAPPPTLPDASASPLGPALVGRPLRRFRPPLPARLELVAGEPAYLWTERFEGALVGRRGAWIASGDWWQEEGSWRRTEWDVGLAQGGLYLLVRTPAGWFVEGEYD